MVDFTWTAGWDQRAARLELIVLFRSGGNKIRSFLLQ